MSRIVTTSAGPLCLSHLDNWTATIDHGETDIHIKLFPKPNPLKARIMLDAMGGELDLPTYLNELHQRIKAEPNLRDMRTDYKAGDSRAFIYYTLNDPDGKGDSLAGFVAIKKFSGRFTRFDFIAAEDFYRTNLKEVLIMADSVQLVE